MHWGNAKHAKILKWLNFKCIPWSDPKGMTDRVQLEAKAAAIRGESASASKPQPSVGDHALQELMAAWVPGAQPSSTNVFCFIISVDLTIPNIIFFSFGPGGEKSVCVRWWDHCCKHSFYFGHGNGDTVHFWVWLRILELPFHPQECQCCCKTTPNKQANKTVYKGARKIAEKSYFQSNSAGNKIY